MNYLAPRRHRISIILLVFISFYLYLNSIKGDFFEWDNSYLIYESPYTRNLKHALDLLKPTYWQKYHPIKQPGSYRPVREISFAIDYRLWRDKSKGFQWTNLFVNSLNVILLYIFLVIYFQSMHPPNAISRTPANDHYRTFPFLTALFFALHPIHTESIIWTKNRSNLLALLFILIACILFCRYYYRRTTINLLLAVIPGTFFFALALASNEIAFVLPVFLLFYILYDRRRFRSRALAALIPCFVLMALYLYFKFHILTIESVASGARENYFDVAPDLKTIPQMLLIFTTIFEYFSLLFFPFELKLERMVDIPSSPTPQALGGMLILAVSILLIYRFRKNKPFVAGLAWIWITLLPVSNIIYLWTRPIAEQRLYVPSVGFCLILVCCLQALHGFLETALSSRTAKIATLLIFLSVLLSYSVRTSLRNREWTQDLDFWKKTAAQSPKSPRVWRTLALIYKKHADFENAKQALLKTISLDPNFADAYFDLAKCYQKQNHMEEAVRTLENLIAFNPHNDIGYQMMGKFLFEAKRYADALPYFEKALLYNDKYSHETHFYLGTIYAREGKHELSVRHLQKSIAINPFYAKAYNDLGNVYYFSNRHALAIETYRKAVEIDPDFSKAYYNLGNAYIKIGDYPKAIAAQLKALAITPLDAQLNNSIGVSYLLSGNDEVAMNYFYMALNQDPRFAESYNNLAVIYARRKRYRLAIQNMEKAEELGWQANPDFLKELEPYRGKSGLSERVVE